ncbi:META domain-containing protein [Pedobacter sp.]|uniref:META domain-containing protein n=1 Tax=Pedobacter sp. TaxID=1411316 RepID=UPI003D7FB959
MKKYLPLLSLILLLFACSTANQKKPSAVNPTESSANLELIGNGTWTLQSIGSKKVDPASHKNGGPTLELRLSESKVFGNGGCNRYSGSIALEQNSITFSDLMSTKMACEALSLETEYLSAISGKKLPLQVKGEYLYLGKAEQLLTFKKAK